MCAGTSAEVVWVEGRFFEGDAVWIVAESFFEEVAPRSEEATFWTVISGRKLSFYGGEGSFRGFVGGRGYTLEESLSVGVGWF